MINIKLPSLRLQQMPLPERPREASRAKPLRPNPTNVRSTSGFLRRDPDAADVQVARGRGKVGHLGACAMLYV